MFSIHVPENGGIVVFWTEVKARNRKTTAAAQEMFVGVTQFPVSVPRIPAIQIFIAKPVPPIGLTREREIDVCL
jgi:hypothetical protein